MTLAVFKKYLTQHPDLEISFWLPDGTEVPEHFHVTEVGRVEKRFIDCGGTRRDKVTCVLQTWVADDVDHRLIAEKLAGILKMAEPLLETDELDLEVEHESHVISQYPVTEVEVGKCALMFQLGTKHTDCLAKEKCLVPGPGGQSCC
jgi:hypothetical protein